MRKIVFLLFYQFTFFVFCLFMAFEKKNCVRKIGNWTWATVQFSLTATAHAHTPFVLTRHSSSSDLYQLIDLTDNGITHGTHKIGWLAVCTRVRARAHSVDCLLARSHARTSIVCPSALYDIFHRCRCEGNPKENWKYIFCYGAQVGFYFVHLCMCAHIKSQATSQAAKQINGFIVHCTPTILVLVGWNGKQLCMHKDITTYTFIWLGLYRIAEAKQKGKKYYMLTPSTQHFYMQIWIRSGYESKINGIKSEAYCI